MHEKEKHSKSAKEPPAEFVAKLIQEQKSKLRALCTLLRAAEILKILGYTGLAAEILDIVGGILLYVPALPPSPHQESCSKEVVKK